MLVAYVSQNPINECVVPRKRGTLFLTTRMARVVVLLLFHSRNSRFPLLS